MASADLASADLASADLASADLPSPAAACAPSVIRTGAPSFSRSVPSVTTRSPGFRPETTTVWVPSVSPVLIGRTVTLLSPSIR
ncbi:hypothetical protein ACLBXO_09130 [Methylobacterium sp. C33D]